MSTFQLARMTMLPSVISRRLRSDTTFYCHHVVINSVEIPSDGVIISGRWIKRAREQNQDMIWITQKTQHPLTNSCLCPESKSYPSSKSTSGKQSWPNPRSSNRVIFTNIPNLSSPWVSAGVLSRSQVSDDISSEVRPQIDLIAPG